MPTKISAPILIFSAFALYGLVHTLLASLPAKDLAYMFFGKAAERYYRLAYTIFSIITFLPVLVLPAWLPDVQWYRVPAPWVYLMLAGQGVSVMLLLYSLLQTGMFQFVGLPQALGIKVNEDRLNTRGLYRYMRHPLYFFTLTFLWLTPVMTSNLAALYSSISIYAVFGALFEERKLVKIFGQEYTTYQKRVPMLVPVRWGDKS
jgi:protein-S-isoprenylcysteine O-methyltransferase Ste14